MEVEVMVNQSRIYRRDSYIYVLLFLEWK